MGTNLSGRFDTRRDAEMAVERLVQEHGIERTDIFIAPVGDANTSGEQVAGADAETAAPGTASRQDAKLTGPIEVSVDVHDEAIATTIRKSLAEFDAHHVEQS